ncbi:MAG: ABC transporter ATP-binding protein [Proteobacteria bacterium]|nr:ABC transporter ATP-binding protein [Pseudomonadota bacterium]
MINLTNLSKRFGPTQAVDNLNLKVAAGKIFAFLGTNGAGKTTTIKLMTGVIQPTSGSIEIGGYNLQKNPMEAKFLMGVVPDRPYLYNKLTGYEYLKFMSDIYKVPSKQSKVIIEELLFEFNLQEKKYDLIETYSHGMKQRLALCGSLIHNPPLLIVDEPMVGLDPRGIKLLKENFQKRAKQGLTIFMSTHTLSIAEEIADQIAIIKKGKIIAEGTLAEIKLYSKEQKDIDLENIFLQIISEGETDNYFTDE